MAAMWGFLSEEAGHSSWMPATMDGTWSPIPAPPGEGYGSSYPAEPLNSDTSSLSPNDADYPRLGADGPWAGTSSKSGMYAFGFPPQADDGQAPCYGSCIESSSCQRQSNSLSRGSYSSDGGLVVADSSQQAQSLIWPITSPDHTDTQSLSPATDLASAQAERAGREKGPRKRGRPRLYDEDGTRRERGPPTKPRKSSSAAAAAQSPPSGTSYPFEPGANQESVGTTPDGQPRRGDSKDEADDLARIRARNKIAASRYRQKTQESIARAEEEEHIVAGKRQELLACASQLREEVFHLKNELLHQAGCGCPLIQDYLSRAVPIFGAHGGAIQSSCSAGHASLGPPPQPLTCETGVVDSVGCLVGALPQVTSPEEYPSHS